VYSKRLDRTHPGCIVIMVDQSGSMEEPIARQAGTSKAVALADAINTLLYELVIRCVKNPNEGPRNYYDIGLIGYGASVGPAWSGALHGRLLVPVSEVANNPVRVAERPQEAAGAAGEQPTVPRVVKTPEWIEAVAGGTTPMCAAFDVTGQLVADWVRAHPDSFPPIIVNISDGAATDGDPLPWAERIVSLSTRDGNVLLFNLNLSALGGEQIMFPATPARLNDPFAQTLFAMSSPLPDYMCQLAGAHGIPVQMGARGFVFNAGVAALVRFLQIGTSTAQAVA